MLDQIFVNHLGLAAMHQRVCNAHNDITVALDRIKNTRPVSKTTVRIRKRYKLTSFAVKTPHGDYCLGNFLSVRPDILHWRATDESRNTAEALDARKIVFNAMHDKSVPILTGSGRDQFRVLSSELRVYAI